MDSTHAKLQPQDPVAAKLGTFVLRAGFVVAALMIAASIFRS
jgi:hypothetical protein